jgi:hypothetical protein
VSAETVILESIVSTVGVDHQVNLAPMGPWLSNPVAMQSLDTADPGFVLRPFEGSRTFENLKRTLRATIHVTDDAALFARAAIGRVSDPSHLVRAAEDGPWAILKRCHRWFAVEITSVSETPPRYEMHCRVIDSAIEAPFFGFNRAKHAIIEAAILATRTHLIAADEVTRQLDALRPLVEKTAGPIERDAFEMLTDEIHNRIDPTAPKRSG